MERDRWRCVVTILCCECVSSNSNGGCNSEFVVVGLAALCDPAAVCSAAVERVCWWLAGYALCSAVQWAHSWFYFHRSQWRSLCVCGRIRSLVGIATFMFSYTPPRSSSASMQLRKNLIKDRLSGRKWRSLIALDSCKCGLPFRRFHFDLLHGVEGVEDNASFASILGDVWEKDGLQKAWSDWHSRPTHTTYGLSCTLEQEDLKERSIIHMTVRLLICEGHFRCHTLHSALRAEHVCVDALTEAVSN